MGLHISISIGARRFEDKLEYGDVIILREGISSAEAQDRFKQLFDEGRREILVEKLVDAVSECVEAGKSSSGRAIFSFSGRMDENNTFSSARRVGGIRIKNELFSVVGGIERCKLSKIKVQENGRGKIVSEEDISTKKKIETDNMGTIIINRITKPMDVIRFLERVRSGVADSGPNERVVIEVG